MKSTAIKIDREAMSGVATMTICVHPTHALRKQKGEARWSANTGQREATLKSIELPFMVVGKVAWATRDSRDDGMGSPAILHPYPASLA